jgi:IS30 family transposase
MAEHKLFTQETRMHVYFCDPHRIRQRGKNENKNMLIRDYFSEAVDFSKFTRKVINNMQKPLKKKPRKTVDCNTPKEYFKESLLR